MIVPYIARLFLLSLACFFALNLTGALAARLAMPAMIRLAGRMPPARAAAMLLALRLFPCALAAIAVFAICVPGYLRFEPRAAEESAGFPCLALALLGAAIWTASLTRAWRAARSSAAFFRQCRPMAPQVRPRCKLRSELRSALIVDLRSPAMALAGIVRPRLIVSNAVLNSLAPAELRAAIRHERAHWNSRDNLKRLLFALAPEAFPCSHLFAGIERAWATFAEWAADDCATAGRPARATALAAALVRVSRMPSAPPAPQLISSLLSTNAGLRARVDRLLCLRDARNTPAPSLPLARGSAIVFTVALLFAALQPATLRGVHQLLEILMR